MKAAAFSILSGSMIGQIYRSDDNEKRSMVANTREGVRRLFGLEIDSRSVLAEPPQLEHQKYAKRVLIHPTSTLEEKNWLKPRYLKLARLLERRGFEPLFILSPERRDSDRLFRSVLAAESRTVISGQRGRISKAL